MNAPAHRATPDPFLGIARQSISRGRASAAPLGSAFCVGRAAAERAAADRVARIAPAPSTPTASAIT